MKNQKNIFFLNGAFLIYSISTVLGKKAALESFLSKPFIFYYACSLCLLFVYMLIWQQVLKKVPLTVAYTNKAVTIIWGMVWGALFFQEMIRWNMLLGALIIMVGLYLIGRNNE